MDTLNEQIQRAAMERFGLIPGSKDFNLDRILRLVAFSLGCRYAAFSVIEGDQQIMIASHGFDEDAVNRGSAMCREVTKSGQALFSHELHEEPDWRSDPWVAPPHSVRTYLGVPVFAATRVPIGTLATMDKARQSIDTPANRRALNDLVRLIEDSLMMRGAAIRDPLTGLYNRRFFLEQIDSEWRRAMRLQLPISMLVIDIDFFKLYNDSAGHLGGDKVIVDVGHVLESKVRRAGDTVCRFGGEEFTMILPVTTESDAALLAESIRSSVEARGHIHPNHPDGPGKPVTVSIGTATVNNKEQLMTYTARDLLQHADDALYNAKRAGRNCVRQAQLP